MADNSDPKIAAANLLRKFKGDKYIHGIGCFGRLGDLAAACGRRALVVASGIGRPWGAPIHDAARRSLAAAGVQIAGDLVPSARPNAPREDLLRIAEAIRQCDGDVVVAICGGSGIDAAKAALAYATLGDACPDLDAYFGVGRITEMLQAHARRMIPIVAAQLASGSAAHLTKYSNITDLATGQKMLIVDDAIVPQRAIFDYRWTVTMSRDFTMDGALDGVAHCLEVLMGLPPERLDEAMGICLLGIELIVQHLKAAVEDPADLPAREALGLGSDLGGYAIMIGGTNGAHLNSFSLVDVLPHGRACAVLNPYYTVFFAPAIEERLRAVGEIYRRAGYVTADLTALHGRDLGRAVAEGMVALSRDIGFPTTLAEVGGFTDDHVARCLAAAKDPKLEMKLKNMPVPLAAETVDDYMGPILDAARTGDFALIRNL
jgi:alcohol dehydrogenase class IV